MSQRYGASWPRPIAVSACSGSTVEMSYHGDSSIPHRAAAVPRLPSNPKVLLCVYITLVYQHNEGLGLCGWMDGWMDTYIVY